MDLSFACILALVSRVFPAKSDLVVLKEGVIGIFFAPAMQVMVYLASAAMKVIDPSIEPLDRVMTVGFMEHTTPTLEGIGVAGLMASIMSTASTLFVRGERVIDIALSCGYDSMSAFITAFREQLGVTPASFFREPHPL
ncbi:helix-turn-helix domain-containing protein [Vreelandella glaciei]|uniref:helix-turn-helix domain-containing protein n=1 Tax=Vreelandella glaciei TaxID=186761 RepID=UPI0030032D11